MRKAWLEAQRDTLAHWLADIEMELSFTQTTTTYIPTIKEQWVKAVQLKLSTTLGDSGNQPAKPKPTDPTPARKHTAKKSGAGQQRSASKTPSREDDPQKGLGKQSQTGDPFDHHVGSVGEAKEDPKSPLGTKLKGTLGTQPKGMTPSTPKGVKPKDPVPKNTAGTTSGGQSMWYKSGYDTKQTGPAAIPLGNILDMTRKLKAGGQPLLQKSPQFKRERKLLQLGGCLKFSLEPLMWWETKQLLYWV